MLKRWWALALVGILAAAGPGCTNFPGIGNGNDNTTEVVSQFIPDDITLDIEELPDEDATSSKANNAAATISGQNAHDRATRAASRVTHAFQRAAQRALALAAIINEDMTAENQTQIAGEFTVNSQQISYLADFSAFDFDGDDVADGSGNAVTDPVALRLWVDRGEGYQRFLCALVVQRPTTENLGKGALYVRPAAARGTEFNDLAIHAEWDRIETSHKWNQAWVTGQLAENYSFENGRLRVDHRVDGDVTGKTVRATTMFGDSPYGFDTFSAAAHWQRGSAAMLLKAQASGGITQLNFADVCVSLTDRAATDAGLCDDFDTQDMEYLDAADATDTDWPAGFPETPTFEAANADNATATSAS